MEISHFVHREIVLFSSWQERLGAPRYLPEEKSILLGVNLALEQSVVPQPDQLVLGFDHEHWRHLDLEEGWTGELPRNVLSVADILPGLCLADVLDPQDGGVLLTGRDVADPASLSDPADLRRGISAHNTGEDGLLPSLGTGVFRGLDDKGRDWKYIFVLCGGEEID